MLIVCECVIVFKSVVKCMCVCVRSKVQLSECVFVCFQKSSKCVDARVCVHVK